ncbi:MAG TPA: hypothetical protein VFT00_03310 [Nocardioides sp.]|nr:hypothetical protein [Nocardioides sp.]
MAGTAADPSDPSVRVLHLGGVDQLRVRVAYGPAPDSPARDVFLLDVPLEVADTFDEEPYLRALEPVLYAAAEAPLPYSVHLHRHHTSLGSPAGTVEIRMDLTTGNGSGRLSTAAVDAVATGFRRVLDHAGAPRRLELRHDDAIDRARAQVQEAYPEMEPAELTVSDEEHRPAQGSWSIGLRRLTDLDRYVVVVGFLDGHPGSAHVHHHRRSEVIDSVGSEVS